MNKTKFEVELSPDTLAAYAALGVKYEDVRQLPQITPHIRMNAAKLRRKKLPSSAYYYLSCSDSPLARKLLDARGSITKTQRSRLPIEAFCAAIGAEPYAVLDLIESVIDNLSQRSQRMISLANAPSIVDASVDAALLPDGFRDRTNILKGVGFLPTPKGSQTTINVQQNASASAAAHVLREAPAPEHTIRTLVDAFNARRGIAPAAEESLPAAPDHDTLTINTPDLVPVEAESEEDE